MLLSATGIIRFNRRVHRASRAILCALWLLTFTAPQPAPPARRPRRRSRHPHRGSVCRQWRERAEGYQGRPLPHRRAVAPRTYHAPVNEAYRSPQDVLAAVAQGTHVILTEHSNSERGYLKVRDSSSLIFRSDTASFRFNTQPHHHHRTASHRTLNPSHRC